MVIERGFELTKRPIIEKAIEFSARKTELLKQRKLKEANAVREQENKTFDDINFLDTELSGVLKRLEERGIKQATLEFQVAKLVFVEPVAPGSENKEDSLAKQTVMVAEPAASSDGHKKEVKRGSREPFLFPDGKKVELIPRFLEIAKSAPFDKDVLITVLAHQLFPEYPEREARQKIATGISQLNKGLKIQKATWAIVNKTPFSGRQKGVEAKYGWVRAGGPEPEGKKENSYVLTSGELLILAERLSNANAEILAKAGLTIHPEDRKEYKEIAHKLNGLEGKKGDKDTLFAKLKLLLGNQREVYKENIRNNPDGDVGMLLAAISTIDSEEKMKQLILVSSVTDVPRITGGDTNTEIRREPRVGALRNEGMTKITNAESLLLATILHDTDPAKLRRLGIEIGAVHRGSLETFIGEMSKITSLPTGEEGMTELKSFLFERLVLFLKNNNKRLFFEDRALSPVLLLQFGFIEKLGRGSKVAAEYKLKQLLSI